MYMNAYGFNNNNPLAELLKSYIPPEPTQAPPEPQRINNGGGIKVYEVRKKDEVQYIRPDDSGQKQIILCEEDNSIYVIRYNYAKKDPDREEFISKGTIDLSPKPDNSAEMGQIAEALSLVAGRLDSMDNAIQKIKNAQPATEPTKAESNRKANGQFKKKGEK